MTTGQDTFVRSTDTYIPANGGLYEGTDQHPSSLLKL